MPHPQTATPLYHPVTIGNRTVGGNVFLAPVAGYSDAAFRSICRGCGANLAYTEMVSAEALYRGSGKTEALMRRAPQEDQYAVQLFGGNEASMAAAVGIVLDSVRPEILDINGGCPVPKIIKSGAGSSLTRDPELLYRVVRSAVQASENWAAEHTARGDGEHAAQEHSVLGRTEPAQDPVPVTVKIRTGWDNGHITFLECAKAALEAGAAAITMHGRTKAQGYEGKADWGKLAELVRFVDGRIPVFGSGDVFSPEDAERMLRATGVDGVMFARGAMGNPFVFTQTRELLTTGAYQPIPPKVRLDTAMNELRLLIAEKGEPTACREMRKRFCCYSKGIPGAAPVRRDIVGAETLAQYERIYESLVLRKC